MILPLYLLAAAVLLYASYEKFSPPPSVDIPNSTREPALYDLFGDTTLETTAIGGRLERTQAGYTGRTAPDKGALGVDFGTNLGVPRSGGQTITERLQTAFSNFAAAVSAPPVSAPSAPSVPQTAATPPSSTYATQQILTAIAATPPAVTQPAPNPTPTYTLPPNFSLANLGYIPGVNGPLF